MNNAKWSGCEILEIDRNWTSAKIGFIDATHLSAKVWPGVEYGKAFAYLFRRFGETGPFDYQKNLCGYWLTTPMEGVGFWLDCAPSRVEPGYALRPDVCDQLENRTIQRTWREDSGWRLIVPENTFMGKCLSAIEAGMVDLLRPVYVRNCPINILGRLTDEEASQYESAGNAWENRED